MNHLPGQELIKVLFLSLLFGVLAVTAGGIVVSENSLNQASTLALTSATVDVDSSAGPAPSGTSFQVPPQTLDDALKDVKTAEEEAPEVKPGECPAGVECKEEKPETRPFNCPSSNPTVQAGCEKNRKLSEIQVSIGVGTAPASMQVTYSSNACNVSTNIGKAGSCNPKPSRACPTVLTSPGGNNCFWSEEKCRAKCEGKPEPKPVDNHPCTGNMTGSAIIGFGGLAHHPCTSNNIGLAGEQVAAADITPVKNGINVPIEDAASASVNQNGTNTQNVASGDPAPANANVQNTSYSPGATPANTNVQNGNVAVVDPGSQVAPSQYTPGSRVTPGSTQGPLATNNGSQYTGPTAQNPYKSFQSPQTLDRPQSFIQRFAGGGSVMDRLANFVTGQAALRNTPEGQTGGGPQIIYVTPQYQTPEVPRGNRSVEELASDIAGSTPKTLARVDHFALTLESVGGPSSIDTENKSYGRIQDLIVEDEAIRALRVAEEEGRRAKNAVFCRANEAANACQQRREEKAKEVERKVFVQELQNRVLPDSAIQHFLAVYDGWVRPSPAPRTRATSTLDALSAQEQDPFAQYEVTTGGDNFILWFMESMADAAINAVTTLTNLILGTPPVEEN